MMLRRILLASAGAIALAATALAADLPSRAPPPVYLPPPPIFTWTGLYVGVNAGYGWGNNKSSNSFAPETDPTDPDPEVDEFFILSHPKLSGGFVGGGQIGYNYQFSPWLVAGIETDFQGTSLKGQSSGAGASTNSPDHVLVATASSRLNWFGTVRGRIGVTPFDPHFLLYGTGGFAYGKVRRGITTADFEPEGDNDFGAAAFSNTRTGWTAGGGVEWAFLPGWSAKVEYLYTDLGGATTLLVPEGTGPIFNTFNIPATRFHTVRAGLNYHFNLWTPGPVVAKY